jgi:hypothetical protein
MLIKIQQLVGNSGCFSKKEKKGISRGECRGWGRGGGGETHNVDQGKGKIFQE